MWDRVTEGVLELLRLHGGVVLGAALALGISAITGFWNTWRRNRAIKKAICLELREVAHRLLAVVHRVGERLGHFDRSQLEWLDRQIRRYSGPNQRDTLLTAVSMMLALSDEQLAATAAHLEASSGHKFVPLPEPRYTIASISQLHESNSKFSIAVLDILSHIHMLNELRDNGLYYFRLTFTPGLSDEKHDRAIDYVDDSEKAIAQRARIIVDKISALEDRFK
jgi:hypothetical protein